MRRSSSASASSPAAADRGAMPRRPGPRSAGHEQRTPAKASLSLFPIFASTPRQNFTCEALSRGDGVKIMTRHRYLRLDARRRVGVPDRGHRARAPLDLFSYYREAFAPHVIVERVRGHLVGARRDDSPPPRDEERRRFLRRPREEEATTERDATISVVARRRRRTRWNAVEAEDEGRIDASEARDRRREPERVNVAQHNGPAGPRTLLVYQMRHGQDLSEPRRPHIVARARCGVERPRFFV